MADIKLVPGGRPVTTTEPNVVVAPMPEFGVYIFTVVVVFEDGVSSEGTWQVTVRRG